MFLVGNSNDSRFKTGARFGFVAILMTLLMALFLVACGPSSEVKAADEAIASIGEVTLDSKGAIDRAQQLVSALTDEEKAQLSNLQILQDAQTRYDELTTIAAVEKAIAAIGEVTLESQSAISAAQEAYSNLPVSLQGQVTNAAVLQDAIATYSALKEKTRDDALKQAAGKFTIETDKIRGVTWYTPKNMPQYINTRCYVIPYIGVQDDAAWIVIRYVYFGDEWVFWKKLTIYVDGKNYYKTYRYSDIDHDNGYGDVWEVLDDPDGSSAENLEILAAIAGAKDATIRFEGDSKYYDYSVSAADKQMIRDVLDLYYAIA